MKTTPHMQQMMYSIADTVGLEPDMAGAAYVQLRDQLLCSAQLDEDLYEISQSHLENDTWQMDWAVCFFTGHKEWVPLSIEGLTDEPCRYGEVVGVPQSVKVSQPAEQALLASFCELWASRIEQGEWLERGSRYH